MLDGIKRAKNKYYFMEDKKETLYIRNLLFVHIDEKYINTL